MHLRCYVDTNNEQSIIVRIKNNSANIPDGGVKEELVINVGREKR